MRPPWEEDMEESGESPAPSSPGGSWSASGTPPPPAGRVTATNPSERLRENIYLTVLATLVQRIVLGKSLDAGDDSGWTDLLEEIMCIGDLEYMPSSEAGPLIREAARELLE